MSVEWNRLRNMTDQEIITRYNNAAKSAAGGLAFWRDELWRRESHRQTATIRRLTWVLVVLTVAVTIATAVNVYLVARTL